MNLNLGTTELNDLLQALRQPQVWSEFALLFGCLVLAYVLVYLLRGRNRPEASIWFGQRVFDGVFFPIMALSLAYLAKAVLFGGTKLAVFKVAIPILMSLAVIRLSVRVMHASFPTSRTVQLLERTVSWMAWAAVISWVTGILPLLLKAMEDVTWKMGATRMDLRTLLEGLLTAGLMLVLALWVASIIERRLLRGEVEDLSLRKIVVNIVRAVLLFVGLLLGLSAVGIDLTALSVLGGAIGVGLGFGLQKIAANYVSGFVILAERSLRIGDTVKVDGFEGRISDIRTRYTVIRALNGREAILPNEMLITARVENSSLADPKVSLTTAVQIAYGSDLPAVQQALIDAVAKVDRVLADPAPAVLLNEFAADGLGLNILFWISDPENGQANVRSDVNLAVLATLKTLGVQIPYPQRVVHQPPLI
ncbi:MAG: mechanosensitive ion channel family protein [Burkholderiales bacterium]